MFFSNTLTLFKKLQKEAFLECADKLQYTVQDIIKYMARKCTQVCHFNTLRYTQINQNPSCLSKLIFEDFAKSKWLNLPRIQKKSYNRSHIVLITETKKFIVISLEIRFCTQLKLVVDC